MLNVEVMLVGITFKEKLLFAHFDVEDQIKVSESQTFKMVTKEKMGKLAIVNSGLIEKVRYRREL